MGSDPFELDFLTILIAYLFLNSGRTAASTFAFGQGLLIDIFSGGLHGLFPLLYLSVFGGIYIGYRFFNLQNPKGQVLLVSLAVLLKKAMFYVVLTVFSPEIIFSGVYILISGSSAICTGVIALIAFCLFNRLKTISFKDVNGASANEL